MGKDIHSHMDGPGTPAGSAPVLFWSGAWGSMGEEKIAVRECDNWTGLEVENPLSLAVKKSYFFATWDNLKDVNLSKICQSKKN